MGARGGNWGRGYREGIVGRPPATFEAPDLTPDRSQIEVSGRSPTISWGDAAKRRRFGTFLQLAAEFGLVVHELDPEAGPNPRKKWSEHRVKVDDALDRIKRAGAKGLPFATFVEEVYLPNPGAEVVPPLLLTAARSRAKVAVSRLYADGAISKRYADDGKLIIVVTKMAYKEEDEK